MTSERFQRLERMVGADGLQKLHASFVAVVGLGAVGSYVTEALARAGVGHLRLVDFDRVGPSNINRQLLALESTMGQCKADLAAARVRDIHPDCLAEPLVLFVRGETVDTVLAGPPDLVVDAIDSLNPKLSLITAAVTRGIPLISAMGAALRTDPTKVRFGPLDEVTYCPLASKVRKKLRRSGVSTHFPCVYSVEPVDHLPPAAVTDDPNSPTDMNAHGRKRRILGSLPTMTGIMGLTLAHEAIRMLLGGRLLSTR